jgi:hypothetical protein
MSVPVIVPSSSKAPVQNNITSYNTTQYNVLEQVRNFIANKLLTIIKSDSDLVQYMNNPRNHASILDQVYDSNRESMIIELNNTPFGKNVDIQMMDVNYASVKNEWLKKKNKNSGSKAPNTKKGGKISKNSVKRGKGPKIRFTTDTQDTQGYRDINEFDNLTAELNELNLVGKKSPAQWDKFEYIIRRLSQLKVSGSGATPPRPDRTDETDKPEKKTPKKPPPKKTPPRPKSKPPSNPSKKAWDEVNEDTSESDNDGRRMRSTMDDLSFRLHNCCLKDPETGKHVSNRNITTTPESTPPRSTTLRPHVYEKVWEETSSKKRMLKNRIKELEEEYGYLGKKVSKARAEEIENEVQNLYNQIGKEIAKDKKNKKNKKPSFYWMPPNDEEDEEEYKNNDEEEEDAPSECDDYGNRISSHSKGGPSRKGTGVYKGESSGSGIRYDLIHPMKLKGKRAVRNFIPDIHPTIAPKASEPQPVIPPIAPEPHRSGMLAGGKELYPPMTAEVTASWKDQPQTAMTSASWEDQPRSGMLASAGYAPEQASAMLASAGKIGGGRKSNPVKTSIRESYPSLKEYIVDKIMGIMSNEKTQESQKTTLIDELTRNKANYKNPKEFDTSKWFSIRKRVISSNIEEKGESSGQLDEPLIPVSKPVHRPVARTGSKYTKPSYDSFEGAEPMSRSGVEGVQYDHAFIEAIHNLSPDMRDRVLNFLEADRPEEAIKIMNMSRRTGSKFTKPLYESFEGAEPVTSVARPAVHRPVGQRKRAQSHRMPQPRPAVNVDESGNFGSYGDHSVPVDNDDDIREEVRPSINHRGSDVSDLFPSIRGERENYLNNDVLNDGLDQLMDAWATQISSSSHGSEDVRRSIHELNPEISEARMDQHLYNIAYHNNIPMQTVMRKGNPNLGHQDPLINKLDELIGIMKDKPKPESTNYEINKPKWDKLGQNKFDVLRVKITYYTVTREGHPSARKYKTVHIPTELYNDLAQSIGKTLVPLASQIPKSCSSSSVVIDNQIFNSLVDLLQESPLTALHLGNITTTVKNKIIFN